MMFESMGGQSQQVAQNQVKESFTIFAEGTVDVLSKSDEEKRLIGGFCSTERLDRQGEVVLQKGLDFHEFVHHGYYNDNHKSDTDAVVGVPHEAFFVRGKGWYTKGEILKGYPRAEGIWLLAKSLAGTPRKLGFSIEGKVLERRNGNQIAKARVRHVAITNSPVNTDCTWETLTKAFCENPGVDESECECCIKSATDTVENSIIVPAHDGTILTPAGQGDLEKGEVRYLYQCPDGGCHRVFQNASALDDHMKGKHEGTEKSLDTVGAVIRRSAEPLSFGEAINRVRLIRGYSPELARRVVELAVARRATS